MSKKGKLLHWLAFARVVLPYTLKAAGVPDDIAGHATALVGDAEQALGDGTGPEKLQSVLDGVQHTMAASGASAATIAATTDAVSVGIASGLRITNDVHAVAASHTSGT